MKAKIGQKYKTNGGHILTVRAISSDGSFHAESEGNMRMFSENGVYYGGDRSLDLIMEPIQPEQNQPFEVGKYYRTRKGSKVVYIGYDPLSEKDKYFNSFIFASALTLFRVDEEGNKYPDSESDDDIISPWDETLTINGKEYEVTEEQLAKIKEIVG
jgi:hypothetical protein